LEHRADVVVAAEPKLATVGKSSGDGFRNQQSAGRVAGG
jgi:hypothetical protein